MKREPNGRKNHRENLQRKTEEKSFKRKHMQHKNKIKLSLTKRSGRFTLTIAVYSTHRKGFKATNEINPAKASNAEELVHIVEMAAGACGEHLCEKYGDLLDPEKCAKVARKAFFDLFKSIAAKGKEVGSITASY